VKAKNSAIVEYNRLRTLYRPDLTDIPSKKSRRRKIKDRTWVSLPGIDNAQESDFSAPQQKPKRSYKKNLQRKKGSGIYITAMSSLFLIQKLTKC